MEASAQLLLTFGGILLLGLLASTIGHRSFLPRVTLLLLLGVLIGREVLHLIPDFIINNFAVIADMALVMVGFLLGSKLTLSSLRDSAGQVMWISITAALVTTITVSLVLLVFGVPKEIAILLGCIAAATAPAAILDVVIEDGKQSVFSRKLLSIVALDDVWALILFSLGMAIATSLNGHAGDISPLLNATKEILGAVMLGCLIGLPAAYLTGRVKPGEPILTEALGLVFVCGGLAIWLDVSYLIASMTMGAIIANIAKHHEYPYHAIEGLEAPTMVIFFVLAGATLEVKALADIGMIGLVYILARSIGKYLGAGIGSQLAHASTGTKEWMGLALFPQAGVAIGMALVASNQFPEYRQVLLPIVISTTIFFEIIGPILTRIAIRKAIE